jgi:transcriptional regulator of nitric oxide reductase
VAVQITAATAVIAVGQSPAGPPLESRLKHLFPAAASFSPKEGNPPHYVAYAAGSGSGPAAPADQHAIVGYAFWTTDLEPLERAYDGPIQILVGINPRGVLAGIIVTAHREPYGNFSVDPPEFAAQFAGKDVRDPFKVGTDIEAVSRATISITSATRAIRNSARRFARQMLVPPDTTK